MLSPNNYERPNVTLLPTDYSRNSYRQSERECVSLELSEDDIGLNELESFLLPLLSLVYLYTNQDQISVINSFVPDLNCEDGFRHEGIEISFDEKLKLNEQEISINNYFDKDKMDFYSSINGAITITEYSKIGKNNSIDLYNKNNFDLDDTDLNIVVDTIYENKLIANYRSDHFNKATVELFLTQLLTIFRKGLKANSCSFNSLYDELKVNEPNIDIQSTVDVKTNIVDTIRKNSLLFGNKVAVKDKYSEISYEELNSRSDSLAKAILEMATAGSNIGISMDHDLDLIVSILAVLKSGCCYVPIDRNLPVDRQEYISEQSNCSIMLTSNSSRSNEKYINVKEFSFDEVEPDFNFPVILPSDPAYIIYTSGSTGKPKGVVVSHLNCLRLFLSTQKDFQFNQNDVWTLFHSYSFDFSVWEIFGALVYGARLVIVDQDSRKNPEKLVDLLIKERVTVLNQTPTSFQQITNLLGKTFSFQDLSLRYVIFGGERLEVRSVTPWLKSRENSASLINMYGITETTVHVTHHQLTVDDLYKADSPIGMPISDLGVMIMDDKQRILPKAIPGEIYVFGSGVTKGYYNNSKLTDERFIEITDENNRTLRLYRTGDLGKVTSTGELVYLGRIDDQVKIRGYRIETGEIDSTIQNIEGVESSCTLVSKNGLGEKVLVSFFISNGPKKVNQKTIKKLISAKLPSYMIPSQIYMVDSFPITKNGKLDRKALLSQISEDKNDFENSVLLSSRENEILKIWEEILGERIKDVEDSFFELGGDSISALSVVSQLNELGYVCDVQDIYIHKTIPVLSSNLIKKSDNEINVEAVESTKFSKSDLSPEVEDAYPITDLQLGMFYHNEMDVNKSTYHDLFLYDIQGEYCYEKLNEVVKATVMKHPILRTSFDITNTLIPLQKVYKEIESGLVELDLSHQSSKEQKLSVKNWVENERSTSFNQVEPGLIRYFSIKKSNNSFILALSFHHAIFDGWSVANLVSELLNRYRSAIENTVYDELEEPETTFKEYCLVESKEKESTSASEFWKGYLSGYEYLNLSDTVGKKSNVNHDESIINIDDSIIDGLKQISQNLQVPLKSIFLSAYLKTLSVLSGRTDIVTGLISNGRLPKKGTDRVLGLFLNTTPIRNLNKNSSWEDYIKGVCENEQRILHARRYPYSKIISDQSGEEILETAFNFTDFRIYDDSKSNSKISIVKNTYYESTNFSLLCYVSKNYFLNAYQVTVSYDTERFDEELIERFNSVYFTVLSRIVDNIEDSHVSCYLENKQSIISSDDMRSINQQLTLLDMYRNAVSRNKNSIAIRHNGREISYSTLDKRVKQISHNLVENFEINKGDRVCIMLGRGVDLIASLLAVTGLGAVISPIDSTFPEERVTKILQSTKPKVVLVDNTTKNINFNQETICNLSSIDKLKVEESYFNRVVCASDSIYILHTSGSTGTPKGVEMSHGSLLNLVEWQIERPYFSKNQNILQFASICFDVSFQEIFSTLVSGKTLNLIDEDIKRNPQELARLITKNNIELVVMPIAALSYLANAVHMLEIERLPIKDIITSGEQLEVSDTLIKMIERCDSCALHNQYGPTETHVVTEYSLYGNPQEWQILPPIGKPINRTSIRILDENRVPVPINAVGEIYVSGAGVAKGYINDTELTNSKFISAPNAFNSNEYRTGDLARQDEEGNIHYVGRIDNQVKIRGYRVELSEIESTILNDSLITHCIVTMDEDANESEVLIAYITTKDNKSISEDQLTDRISKVLPEYMIPSYIVNIDKFPMNSNGKIDRAMLPKPVRKTEFEALEDSSLTKTQNELIQIWEGVLHKDISSIDSKFFQIGGTSLLLLKVFVKIKEELYDRFEMVDLFRYTTIRKIADHIDRCLEIKIENDVVNKPVKKRQSFRSRDVRRNSRKKEELV